MSGTLPIDAISNRFLEEIARRPVIITAPTGTGKSTQVPRWAYGQSGSAAGGPIVVVQPRRVAARAVAARIAELEGAELGEEIGYRVRDDNRSGQNTRLLVATPGIVLAQPELLERASLVILDELHERRLDTDLIFALLSKKKAPFVAMSATMDGEAVSCAVAGVHLSVSVRSFPVTVEYLDAGPDLPSSRDLENKVRTALDRLPSDGGDVLVFLPGKGEIEQIKASLAHRSERIVPLHGSLSLADQAKALRPSEGRRIILSTNVAETSLTIDGVRTVIDSGLVRRTTYHNGRSYLTLTQIALDSADQRTGRAGRTAPGYCLRLWGRQARLSTETPPEIHREELGPLVMTCAALGVSPQSLPFLDEPKDYALRDATERLQQLGVVSAETEDTPPRLTDTGRQLFGLPLDPWLSRILIEAKRSGCIDDAIDLVAVLEQPGTSALSRSAPDDQLEYRGCDVEALIYMIRSGRGETGQQRRALEEARASARRLRRALGLSGDGPDGGLSDRALLLNTLLDADPVCAHVARHRKKRIVFSNGGTEMEVGRDSRVGHLLASVNPADKVDAIIVLETHGISSGKDHKLLITLCTPVPTSLLSRHELGQVAVRHAQIAKSGPDRGKIVVTLERSYAGRVIDTREQIPEGSFARQATVELIARGTLHPKVKNEAQRRLARLALGHALGKSPEFSHFKEIDEPPSLQEFLLARLTELGVESCDDLELLSTTDFLPADVPAHLSPQLDERFPLEVDLGDCLYAVEYDLARHQATLSIVRGGRHKPPPANYLPRFEGLRVFVEAGGSFHALRR